MNGEKFKELAIRFAEEDRGASKENKLCVLCEFNLADFAVKIIQAKIN